MRVTTKKTASDMTHGEPLRLMLRFAIPLMAGNVFQQLYNVVDSAVVGRFVGADALGAVGSVGSVLFFMNTLLYGLCAGTGIIVAQYWGGERYAELKKLLGTLCTLMTGLTLVLSVLGVLLAPWALRVLRLPAALMPDALGYMRISLGFMLGSAVYNAAGAVLRSMGNSRTPLAAMIVSSLTNIGLDLLFILKFGLGVRGAALATVLSQCLSAAVCVGYLLRCHTPFRFASVRFAFDARCARLLLSVSLPSALQSSMISLGGMSVQGLVNSFGAPVMAAYTAAQRIDSMTIQVVVALSNALAVFTGQNVGTGNLARIRTALYKMLALQLACCGVLAAFVFTCRRLLLGIFLDPGETESIAYGCQYLAIIGTAYLIAGVMNSYINLIRGAGDVNVSVAAGLFELGARVLFAYTLAPRLGVLGIWLATPLSWGCGCIIPVVRYYSGKWETKAL